MITDEADTRLYQGHRAILPALIAYEGRGDSVYFALHPGEENMNTLSFMTANYVARQVGYHMTEGWGQGDRATNEYFRPLETFPERFEEILRDVRDAGFDTLDLWMAHLSWEWATPEHVAAAVELLRKHDLKVASLGGGFGSTREDFAAACRIAVAVDTTILGGNTALLAQDRETVVSLLREHDVRLAIENHPERTPEEMLAKIGDGADGRLATAVDTGWYATHGYNAAQAIERLQGHILHVHLKDITEPGKHITCRYGEGVVPLHGCVEALRRGGYEGVISVEHEPEEHDPTEDVRASAEMLRGWLTE